MANQKIAAIIDGIAFDATGFQVASADLSETLKPAPRSETLKVVKCIQHENDAPDRCQDNDPDDDKPQDNVGGGVTLQHADGRSERISVIRLSGFSSEDRERLGLPPVNRRAPISVRIRQ